MSNVIPFPRIEDAAELSGCTMRADSHSDLRAKAWNNFYTQERRDGTDANLAAQRADFFITNRFDGLIEDITKIMAERR